MKENYKSLLLKFTLGLLVIIGIQWLVKCQCINLKSLTPGSIRDHIQSFGNLAALAYVIAYTVNTISVFPPIAAISLTAGLAFGTVGGAILLMAGAMLGTSLTFFISRFFARALIEELLKGKFRNLDENLEKNGFMSILFFRVIPLVPYEVLNYACGLSKIRFKDYFFATFLGLIPGVVIAAFFGGSLGRVKTFKDIFVPRFLLAAGLTLLIIAVPLCYQIFKKKISKRRSP